MSPSHLIHCRRWSSTRTMSTRTWDWTPFFASTKSRNSRFCQWNYIEILILRSWIVRFQSNPVTKKTTSLTSLLKFHKGWQELFVAFGFSVSHFKHCAAACGTWCQEAGLFDFVPKVVIELIRSRQAQGQKIFEGFVKREKRASKMKWLVKDCSMLQYSAAYNLKFQEGNNKRVLLVVLLWADATGACSAYACIDVINVWISMMV